MLCEFDPQIIYNLTEMALMMSLPAPPPMAMFADSVPTECNAS